MHLKVIRSNVAVINSRVINFFQHHFNIVKAPQNIFRAARAGEDDMQLRRIPSNSLMEVADVKSPNTWMASL